MKIRRAEDKDISRILELLVQVCNVHAKLRPDLFIMNGTKYTEEDLKEIIRDEKRPIYIAVDDEDQLIGYCFCEYKEPASSKCIKPFSQIYIDDLCVDESARGMHVGRQLFEYTKHEAKKMGCYEITLNVWEGNDSARAFYEKMGMKPKETMMEIIL